MAGKLDGSVALVTGGAKNIGRAICLALASEGAKVAVNALSSAAEAEALASEIRNGGGDAEAFIADVTEPQTVRKLVDDVVARFGKLTILVNNASTRSKIPFAEMSLDEWRHVQSICVEGVFLCSQAALPRIAEAGGGSIVSIGGLSGHSGIKDRIHAATAKAAVEGFTKSLAFEGAEFNVRANCVVPGLIETVRGATAGVIPEGHPGYRYLLEGLGRPEDIAEMVLALCGPAGRYVTGQAVHVNGGSYLP